MFPSHGSTARVISEEARVVLQCPNDISKPLIDEIKDGTVLFIYHPTSAYISRSKLVR